MDSAAANQYLTHEERGWLKEAREEIAMDAVGLCHDVPVMLGRYAAALKALEKAQGELKAVGDAWENYECRRYTDSFAMKVIGSILRGSKEGGEA